MDIQVDEFRITAEIGGRKISHVVVDDNPGGELKRGEEGEGRNTIENS